MTDITTQDMAKTLEIKSKISELADAILARHPRMPTLLREIHTTLRQYPEQVSLLSEEEIAPIVSGLLVQTNTQFAQAALKSKSSAKSVEAKIKALGVDAI